jgi:hypothetical protein
MPVRSPHIVPGDVSAEGAGRRLGLTLAEFEAALPKLVQRGFPRADATTGLFDLDAVDAWRRARNPHLFGLTPTPAAADARTGIVRARLEAMRRG